MALARAAYSGASVHLLDDPLSAVDPRVGQVLFDKCIGPTGLLNGKWRLPPSAIITGPLLQGACPTTCVMSSGQSWFRMHLGCYSMCFVLSVPACACLCCQHSVCFQVFATAIL